MSNETNGIIGDNIASLTENEKRDLLNDLANSLGIHFHSPTPKQSRAKKTEANNCSRN